VENPLRRLKLLIVRAIEKVQSLALYRTAAARVRPEVQISEATEADLQAANKWFNPGETDRPQRHAPGVTNYVAKHRNRIVGFLQLVRRRDDTGPHGGFWLYSLRVRLTYRGMGLGETLCQRVIQQAQTEGAPELALLVVDSNHAAIALYRKLGFARKSVPELDALLERDREVHGWRRIVMSKYLT
jgi:ribosomal protein S18 acetylase RimI-like enzyme